MLLKNKQLSSKAKAKIDQKKIDLRESLRGSKGDEGPQGIQGEKGLDGKQGPIGKTGMQGEAGPRGLRGPQGEQGQKGTRGEPGKDGIDGEDGRGIVRMQILKMDLIVTYTDGEKVNLGRVVGDRGPKGDKGRSGYAFGDTISNTTNITEEVLDEADSANLAAIADTVNLQLNEQRCQQEKLNKKMNKILLHLGEMTEEEFTEQDIIDEEL